MNAVKKNISLILAVFTYSATILSFPKPGNTIKKHSGSSVHQSISRNDAYYSFNLDGPGKSVKDFINQSENILKRTQGIWGLKAAFIIKLNVINYYFFGIKGTLKDLLKIHIFPFHSFW